MFYDISTPFYYGNNFLKCNILRWLCYFQMTRNQITLVIIAIVAAAGLVGSVVSGTPVYADESETSTEQKIKQENVCSGFAVCSNTAENLIDGGFCSARYYRPSFYFFLKEECVCGCRFKACILLIRSQYCKRDLLTMYFLGDSFHLRANLSIYETFFLFLCPPINLT